METSETRAKREQREKFRLLFLLSLPFLIWALPAGFFDNTGIVICPSFLLLGLECLGCGMTRALLHFHHFEWETALQFNRGVVVVYPAMVIIWAKWVWKLRKSFQSSG